ncbi:hypothetical protein V7159_24780 [Priestia megaterium]|uniref:hypothetical protein n=1 Tax=Priestia megaterium TaxID=1404 RepID=UPI0030098FBB
MKHKQEEHLEAKLIEQELDALDAKLEKMKTERAPHEEFEKIEQKGRELFEKLFEAKAQMNARSGYDAKEGMKKFSKDTFNKWINESNEIRRKRAELSKEYFTLESQGNATDEQLINLEVKIKSLNDEDLHLRDRMIVVLKANEWSEEELEYFDKRFFEEYHRSEGNNIQKVIANW